jgi:hypothetical protein
VEFNAAKGELERVGTAGAVGAASAIAANSSAAKECPGAHLMGETQLQRANTVAHPATTLHQQQAKPTRALTKANTTTGCPYSAKEA